MFNQFLEVGVTILVAFSLLYFVAIFLKNNSIVDTFWGLSFIIAAVTAVSLTTTYRTPQVFVTVLVLIWGLRLSFRIYRRNRGKPEDFRYAAWRSNWGKWVYVRSYTDIFLLQAVMCFIISLPVIYMTFHGSYINNRIIYLLGLSVWIVGFLFESIGDYQLDKFKKSKHAKGDVMNLGLWKFSRHPNYFGEATQWWGIWIIVIACSPAGWWTVIGPITITFLLLKVSGVPLLERKMSQNPKYQEYMSHTNKFIPGPVKP